MASMTTGLKSRIGLLTRSLVRGAVAIPMLPVVVLAAFVTRFASRRDPRDDILPRLMWGPVPILSIKYWSDALKQRGFESKTCVFGFYAIHQRSDFDVHYDDFLPRGLLFEAFRPYAVFLWVLRETEIYSSYFDGGFLQMTALRRIELPLLRLARIRLIVSPYGSDIAVLGHLSVAERPLLEDYPGIQAQSERVRQRVDEFVRSADLIVRNCQYGYLPRWDVLWPTQFALDVDRWRPSGTIGNADGHNGEVVVVHAPNHRNIKGTDCLVDAINELRRSGLNVRLDLVERRPNEEVREAVLKSDIVAEQFIAGYALFGIEGMAAGRPVLSALSWMPDDIRADLDARGLPIVDADCNSLVVALRELIEDPARRRALGTAGRRFVVENHSYDAAATMWESIVHHVWRREPYVGPAARTPRDC